ncbi:MAG: hypothetical protein ABJ242_03690 [Marinomonas sp.]
MVLLAIYVSRFEAIEAACMLRGYGLLVSLDGEAHAATEYISLALGGHRLRVAKADYETASEILRQCGAETDTREIRPPTRVLKWLVGLAVTAYSAFIVPTVIFGAAPAYYLLQIPAGIYTLPVNPQGRPEYFLAEA